MKDEKAGEERARFCTLAQWRVEGRKKVEMRNEQEAFLCADL
jgi:hypothetical protein